MNSYRCEGFVRQLSALGLVSSEQVSGLYSSLDEATVRESEDGPCEVCEFYTIMDLMASELICLRRYLHEKGLEPDFNKFKEDYWNKFKQAVAIISAEKQASEGNGKCGLFDIINSIQIPKEN